MMPGLPLAIAVGLGVLFLLRRSGGVAMLSQHFSLSELTATSKPYDNSPGAVELAHLQVLARELLEPIRELLGRPVFVSSGYRSPEVNAAVEGSSSSSAHVQGYAADIWSPGYSSEDLHKLVEEWRDEGLLPELGEAIHYHSSRSSSLHIAHKDGSREQSLYGLESGGYEEWSP